MISFWQRLAAAGFLLFLLLFLTGLVRAFNLKEGELIILPNPVLAGFSGSEGEYRVNNFLASNLKELGLAKTPLPKVLDQEEVVQIRVFEKTGQLASGSTAFPEDEKQVRQAMARQRAVIFTEKASGIAPERRLSLGIAVHPDRFDDLLDELTKVGQLASFTMEQQDRTGEFRKLHAQRQSLKKHQEAILKLRDTSKLTVEEALRLEQKLLDIDKEAQSLGVQLGDLLGKEPAYNLYISLQEHAPGSVHDRGFVFPRRLGNGFLWAVGWWCVAVLGVGLGVATYLSFRILWPHTGKRTLPAAPA